MLSIFSVAQFHVKQRNLKTKNCFGKNKPNTAQRQQHFEKHTTIGAVVAIYTRMDKLDHMVKIVINGLTRIYSCLGKCEIYFQKS